MKTYRALLKTEYIDRDIKIDYMLVDDGDSSKPKIIETDLYIEEKTEIEHRYAVSLISSLCSEDHESFKDSAFEIINESHGAINYILEEELKYFINRLDEYHFIYDLPELSNLMFNFDDNEKKIKELMIKTIESNNYIFENLSNWKIARLFIAATRLYNRELIHIGDLNFNKIENFNLSKI